MVQTTKVFLLERTQKGLSGTNVIGKDGKVAVMITGGHAFTTTGTSVEVSVKDEGGLTMGILTADVLSVNLTSKDGTPVDDDQLSTDGTVTTDAVTVFRNAGTTSGQTFYYTIIALVGSRYGYSIR